MNDHTIHGVYHTGIAYTWYECTDCGEEGGTPRSFSKECKGAAQNAERAAEELQR